MLFGWKIAEKELFTILCDLMQRTWDIKVQDFNDKAGKAKVTVVGAHFFFLCMPFLSVHQASLQVYSLKVGLIRKTIVIEKQ